MSEFSLHLGPHPAPPCSPETTIPQIFAVMRQWIPSIQHNMASLTREVLKRGAHVNDRDGLSDLALLHYAVKSGAGEGREQSCQTSLNLSDLYTCSTLMHTLYLPVHT